MENIVLTVQHHAINVSFRTIIFNAQAA